MESFAFKGLCSFLAEFSKCNESLNLLPRLFLIIIISAVLSMATLSSACRRVRDEGNRDIFPLCRHPGVHVSSRQNLLLIVPLISSRPLLAKLGTARGLQQAETVRNLRRGVT